jgi:hypothetical protein
VGTRACRRSKLRQLYVERRLSAQVGAALGVSAQTVLRRLHAAGLPVRSGGPPRRHRPRPDQLLLAEL